ncbi:MAG: hypothetical protein HY063_08500 [Bacteroidetes bacterium]|nr:hypothetical protein [Bacteroidota bacterium]
MKTKIFFYLLISTSCFFSCSSDKEKNANDSKKDSITIDTTLRGKVGVIEKNPPVQQGDYILKYSNGVIKMRGYYINGKRNGQWTSFFENGNVQSEGFFKDGFRDGSAKVYYESEKLYYEGYYKDGKETGKWIFYDEQGNKIQEKDYDKPNS